MLLVAGIRVDKWLWAARFYKSRGLAQKAVTGGHVHVNEQRVKPAHALQPGDRLHIRKGDLRFEVDVVDLSDRRGSATAAQALYRETQASVERRQREAEERRFRRAGAVGPESRPDKRDRARLRRIKRERE